VTGRASGVKNSHAMLLTNPLVSLLVIKDSSEHSKIQKVSLNENPSNPCKH